ncbi:MAG TPA: polysaccharide biosynthesis/export family protein [Pyrinomonadaceae bacterium]|nr:polysaccharide biosynthesis/export family protein [Pyrinomonadaceae bacterium]
MKQVKIILLLFVFVFLLNVSITKTLGQSTENTKPVEKSDSTEEKKNTLPKIEKSENSEIQKNIGITSNQNPYKDTKNERYRIGFQDTLEVNVFRHPELSQSVAVNPDGTIYLPRIDIPIVAVCKTEGELKDNITTLYKNYLRNPFVNVRVSDQRSQGFAVIGAVQKPGNFFLNRRVRLLELLSLAGGQDVEFAGGKIQVARIGSVAACKEKVETPDEKDDFEFLSFTLRDVLEGKQNPWMQPGDIISVLKSEEAYVIGNVGKPTKIPLDEPKTLTQAIAFAEGVNDTANTVKVIIERQASANSPKMDLVFNLKDIKSKKIPDPLLQANDIVDVGNDKLKSIRKGLLKTLTNGLPNVFYKF